MLEKIQQLVRQYAGDTVINNPAIPNEKNDEVISVASDSIVSGLKSAAANGNTESIMSLFNGGSEAAATSPVTQKIQGNFVENLVSKLGLQQGVASGIAGSLIPMVLKSLVHKTNDAGDSSFNLSSIVSSLVPGAGLGNIVNNMTAGKADDEGGMLGKIKGMFN